MKVLKTFILCLAAITVMGIVTSCGNKSKSQSDTELLGKEYTSDYVCPMHCEGSGSDQAGTCPVCGMDYVLNKEHQTDGHKHEDDSDHGHDH